MKSVAGGLILFVMVIAIWKLFIKNILYRPTVKQLMALQKKLLFSTNMTSAEYEIYASIATGNYKVVMKLWREVSKRN